MAGAGGSGGDGKWHPSTVQICTTAQPPKLPCEPLGYICIMIPFDLDKTNQDIWFQDHCLTDPSVYGVMSCKGEWCSACCNKIPAP